MPRPGALLPFVPCVCPVLLFVGGLFGGGSSSRNPTPPARRSIRTHTYWLATGPQTQRAPFQVLHFLDDSSFVAVRGSGVVVQADSVHLFHELGYTTYRGRVNWHRPVPCLAYSAVYKTMRYVGEVLPHREVSLACRSTAPDALVLSGATLRRVRPQRLATQFRADLLHDVQQPDRTQLLFDCP
jgi:hypothetical protein